MVNDGCIPLSFVYHFIHWCYAGIKKLDVVHLGTGLPQSVTWTQTMRSDARAALRALRGGAVSAVPRAMREIL